MRIKLSYLFLVLSWVSIINCSKQDATLENTKLLSQTVWKITALRSKINPNLWINHLSNIPKCEKDDILFFLPNGVIIFNTGLTNCDGPDNETHQGTWEFTNHGSNLRISGAIPVAFHQYAITQLDENILQLTSIRKSNTTVIEILEQTYSSK